MLFDTYKLSSYVPETIDTANGSTEGALKVLLVEDSPLLADQISELLASTSVAEPVGIAATERDAIDLNAKHTPDLVILDLHLRQGTGFGVLRAISHDSKRPTVVVLTNYALPQYRQQALALGANHFLDKSSDFDLLPSLIVDISKQMNARRQADA